MRRPIELNGHEAFDRLDAWLRLSGGVEEVISVYNDLARIAPDSPLVMIRGAMAAMELDPARGRPIAAGVLERFEDRLPDDPDLQELARRIAEAKPE